MLLPDGGNETTAQRLVRHFKAIDVDRAEVNGEQLKPLYKALSKSAHTAFGANIRLPQLPPASRPVSDKVWGVIVESRKHPSLEYIVNLFSRRLGVGIQLFHSTANESFIKNTSISALIEQGKVVLTSLRFETLSPVQYNALLLSKVFWNAVIGRQKILVFQTDSILCPKSEYALDDFLEFDYIGSKWPRERPISMVIDGGNGGLSLRDWGKSMECLNRFPAKLWPGGEDGYFAFHIDLIADRVGRPKDCAKFSTQSEFLACSFGAHKISELDENSLKKFLEYCPEARKILD